MAGFGASAGDQVGWGSAATRANCGLKTSRAGAVVRGAISMGGDKEKHVTVTMDFDVLNDPIGEFLENSK